MVWKLICNLGPGPRFGGKKRGFSISLPFPLPLFCARKKKKNWLPKLLENPQSMLHIASLQVWPCIRRMRNFEPHLCGMAALWNFYYWQWRMNLELQIHQNINSSRWIISEKVSFFLQILPGNKKEEERRRRKKKEERNQAMLNSNPLSFLPHTLAVNVIQKSGSMISMEDAFDRFFFLQKTKMVYFCQSKQWKEEKRKRG